MEIYVKELRNLILAENQKQNLISRKTAEQEIDKHIEDSLALLNWISLEQERVIDIGSGAGFPGLVLALACPGSQFTLLESDLKKSRFLEQAVQELKLINVQVIRERAELAGRDPLYRERFSVATARAVAKIRVMLEYALPLLALQGTLWLWKGPGYQTEITEAKQALNCLSASVRECYRYQASDGNERVLLKIEKNKATDAAYPRKVGIPGKRPL